MTKTECNFETRFGPNIFVCWLLLIAALSLPNALSNGLLAQDAQDEDWSDAVVLLNARIYDVDSATVSSPQSILIQGERIQAIEALPAQQGDVSQVDGVYDLQGRIVMPGLIDLHSHLLLHPYNEASWNEQVLNESLELRTIRGTVAAKQTVQAGFTSIRDLGTEGAGFADVALRDAINQGIIQGPRVFTATKAMVTTGGYGPSGFDPRWKMPVGAQVADGVAECRRVARQQIAAGADWIKIYADYRRRPGDPSTPTFSQEELNAIVDEAKSAGVPVAAHASTDVGILRCITAGVQTIEHGYDASPETLAKMGSAGVVLCPTLMASESIARYQGWNPATDPEHPRVTTAKRLMKSALENGVTIGCGSDVGVFAHGDNARELELMYAYGMPIDRVIRSATSVAAKVLGKADSLGRVEAGFLADLIVVDQNPTEELSTLRSPRLVIKNGQVVFQDIRSDRTDFTLNTPIAPTNPSNTAGQPKGRTRVLAPPPRRRIRNNESTKRTPQIQRETKGSTSRQTGTTNNNSNTNSELLIVRVQQNGSFESDGQTLSPGQLARQLNQATEDGKTVRFVTSRSTPSEVVERVRQWLVNRGVTDPTIEIVD